MTGLTAAGAAAAALPATLDTAFIAEALADYGENLFAEILESFEEEAGPALAKLERASATGDPSAAYEALHFLRGGACNLGLAAFLEVAERLEIAARGGDAPDPTVTTELVALFGRSLIALRLFVAPER